ncbi:MAG: hypothetical protein ABI914_04355 [Acidobacteriota bacterium]
MFVGHFGAAFAAKRAAPRVLLGTLFLSFQFADLLWPVLLIVGVEHVRAAPGLMPTNPYDFYDYPISHSLTALTLWGALFGAAHWFRRRDTRAAIVLAAGVVSHWFLDALMHRPDVPVFPRGPYVGLGLWRSVFLTVAIEGSLYAAGIAMYLSSTRPKDRTGTWSLWALVAFLGAGWASSVGTMKAVDAGKLAWGALALWLVVPWGYWIDRHRTARAGRSRQSIGDVVIAPPAP